MVKIQLWQRKSEFYQIHFKPSSKVFQDTKYNFRRFNAEENSTYIATWSILMPLTFR